MHLIRNAGEDMEGLHRIIASFQQVIADVLRAHPGHELKVEIMEESWFDGQFHQPRSDDPINSVRLKASAPGRVTVIDLHLACSGDFRLRSPRIDRHYIAEEGGPTARDFFRSTTWMIEQLQAYLEHSRLEKQFEAAA